MGTRKGVSSSPAMLGTAAPGARVDEHERGRERADAAQAEGYFQRVRGRKSRVAVEHRNSVLLLGQVLVHAPAQLLHDAVFALHYYRHIHYNAGVEAVGGVGVGVVGPLGGGQHGLGGRAAVVDAGATKLVFLNQHDPAAGFGKGGSQRIAGLAGANNNNVEGFGHKSGTLGRIKWNGIRKQTER